MNTTEFLKAKGLIKEGFSQFLITGDFGEVNLGDLLNEFAGVKDGVMLIARERQEQIEKHGFSVKEDVEFYQKNELIKAALFCIDTSVFEWPFYWQEEFRGKILAKTDPVERLRVAGALIAAEIDRRQSIK